MRAMARDDVKVGAVLRYHPIITREDYRLVRITDEPYQLGSGDWICAATALDNGQRVRPALCALRPHNVVADASPPLRPLAEDKE